MDCRNDGPSSSRDPGDDDDDEFLCGGKPLHGLDDVRGVAVDFFGEPGIGKDFGLQFVQVVGERLSPLFEDLDATIQARPVHVRLAPVEAVFFGSLHLPSGLTGQRKTAQNVGRGTITLVTRRNTGPGLLVARPVAYSVGRAALLPDVGEGPVYENP